MTSRLTLTRLVAGAAVVAGLSGALSAQQGSILSQPGLPEQPMPDSPQGVPTQPPDRPTIPVYDDGTVEVLHIRDNAYLVAGAGANVVMQTGRQGLLLVNTGPTPEAGEAVVAAIREHISDDPIRLILSTGADEELTGAHEVVSNSGANINAGVGGVTGREPSRIDGAPKCGDDPANVGTPPLPPFVLQGADPGRRQLG